MVRTLYLRLLTRGLPDPLFDIQLNIYLSPQNNDRAEFMRVDLSYLLLGTFHIHIYSSRKTQILLIFSLRVEQSVLTTICFIYSCIIALNIYFLFFYIQKKLMNSFRLRLRKLIFSDICFFLQCKVHNILFQLLKGCQRFGEKKICMNQYRE